jgi:gas vesicle protein
MPAKSNWRLTREEIKKYIRTNQEELKQYIRTSQEEVKNGICAFQKELKREIRDTKAAQSESEETVKDTLDIYSAFPG